MALPTSPTSIQKTIPSYLYFQYSNDPDLPSLIKAYNIITQEYVDWFNSVNLPIYTHLSGSLLDWVGQGLYGITRPVFSSSTVEGVMGQIASIMNVGSARIPTPNVGNGISTTKIYQTTTIYSTPDDVYKRCITWMFYKGDGTTFSITWLKRRIYRFLHGINGTDSSPVFTPDISVTFDDSTLPLPTCNIDLTNTNAEGINLIAIYFQLAVEQGILSLPFRFAYNVTITS